MPDNGLFLQTIEAVYASGLESDRLPEALDATSRLLGAAGATLEVLDKATQRHRAFYAAGLADVARAPYLEEFAALNPRYLFISRLQPGCVAWDHQILDEAAMGRDPFYAEFLPHVGLRYFVAAVLEHTPETFAGVSFQRTRKQGHVNKREIALMERLTPHFRRAHDVATRLGVVGDRRGVLENALEWLADGVALLRADGNIVYANDTMHVLATRGDGFRIHDRTIEFASPFVRSRFETALGAMRQIGDPASDACPTDFPVPRSGGMPAYIVSMRPLVRGRNRATQHTQADVMLLIRDPLWRSSATNQILQELFSLTNAEAHLTQALCTGLTTGAYAAERGVSLNTVYSHLKRIREKTGCKSIPELIRKYGECNIPLRPS
jgi:DNA-binding CsgD family transcriptional regulator